jgi:hypothetical protein
VNLPHSPFTANSDIKIMDEDFDEDDEGAGEGDDSSGDGESAAGHRVLTK